MNPENCSILVCDDNIDHLMLIKRELERHSPTFQVTTVTSAQVFRQEQARAPHDVVIIDYLLRDVNGLDLLREVTAQHPGTVAIMITGMGNEDVAVQAMKSGAGDYVIKSSGSFAVVPLVVERALERRALLASKTALEGQVGRASQLQVLGTLALGVAHDLNGLLTAILGRAETLRRTVDAESARELAVIESAARDAAVIVGRVLAFAGGRPAQPPVAVPLAAAVRDCLEFTRSRWESDARRRGVAYHLALDLPEELTVEAQPAAVREVITNLIVNALEAMPEGGTLFVRARQDERRAQLFVQDTGVGMTRAQLDALFDVDRGSDKPGGHGIGLATCLALLGEMGGSIRVESELDVGTTCEVVLPLRAATAVAGAATATAPAGLPAAGLRVLVVDNEPRVAELLADVLAADGRQVVVAFSGEEAMSKFAPDGFDLIFCDLSLPGMSGLEVARAARALDPVVATVLVTGWGGEGELTGTAGGAVDLTALKPLDVAAIRALTVEGALIASARRDGIARG
ncbi:MAG: response regulator [Candidatus Krumholzibacteriia bacterium]